MSWAEKTEFNEFELAFLLGILVINIMLVDVHFLLIADVRLLLNIQSKRLIVPIFKNENFIYSVKITTLKARLSIRHTRQRDMRHATARLKL